jgi:hypothetical protein
VTGVQLIGKIQRLLVINLARLTGVTGQEIQLPEVLMLQVLFIQLRIFKLVNMSVFVNRFDLAPDDRPTLTSFLGELGTAKGVPRGAKPAPRRQFSLGKRDFFKR